MKVGIIYWSGTGNTEMMANAIAEGAGRTGAEVDVIPVSRTTAEQALSYDRLALGCPAMGAEQLEESEFEPFFAELEKDYPGKKLLYSALMNGVRKGSGWMSGRREPWQTGQRSARVQG